ncbi:MAG: GTP-binding protein [Thermoanaerobaculia bacterium]
MKLVIFAGPASTGKTSVIRHLIKKLISEKRKVSFLKIDVQYADEDELIKREYDIPTKKIYSGELCPDHCSVLVLGDAIRWAKDMSSAFLFIETAGLCLRCAPYVDGGLGVVVMECTSGMNLPRKIGPMLSLADLAVVTKIDLVSQAEREVFRERIHETAPDVIIKEVNALQGVGIDSILNIIKRFPNVKNTLTLKGNPPVGTCTICVGKKEIGWESHFGVVRSLSEDLFYRGE